MQNRSLLGDRSRNNNTESNAFTNDRSTFTQAEGHSYSRDSDEILTGASLMSEIRRMCRDKFTKIGDIIKRWQIYDNIKCVHENAVNSMQEPTIWDLYSHHEEFFNHRGSLVFDLENAAVLSAIEWKGLKMIRPWYEDVERFKKQHSDGFKDNDDNVDHCCYPSSEREYISADCDVKIEEGDYEIQESNVETNFLTVAVSSAIEMIGLAHEEQS